MTQNNNNNICLFCLEHTDEIYENMFGCDCQLSFHGSCMKSWLSIRFKCPICKFTNSEITTIPSPPSSTHSDVTIVGHFDESSCLDRPLFIATNIVVFVSLFFGILFYVLSINKLIRF